MKCPYCKHDIGERSGEARREKASRPLVRMLRKVQKAPVRYAVCIGNNKMGYYLSLEKAREEAHKLSRRHQKLNVNIMTIQ